MSLEQAPWYPILKALVFGLGVLLAIPLFDFFDWLFTSLNRRSLQESEKECLKICEKSSKAYWASLYGIYPKSREPDCMYSESDETARQKDSSPPRGS